MRKYWGVMFRLLGALVSKASKIQNSVSDCFTGSENLHPSSPPPIQAFEGRLRRGSRILASLSRRQLDPRLRGDDEVRVDSQLGSHLFGSCLSGVGI